MMEWIFAAAAVLVGPQECPIPLEYTGLTLCGSVAISTDAPMSSDDDAEFLERLWRENEGIAQSLKLHFQRPVVLNSQGHHHLSGSYLDFSGVIVPPGQPLITFSPSPIPEDSIITFTLFFGPLGAKLIKQPDKP